MIKIKSALSIRSGLLDVFDALLHVFAELLPDSDTEFSFQFVGVFQLRRQHLSEGLDLFFRLRKGERWKSDVMNEQTETQKTNTNQ